MTDLTLMEILRAFVDTDTIAVTFPGYPMSWIELIGTLFYLLSVWLIAKRNMLTWPSGIVSVVLFFFLFYQIRLYADALEQIYYLGACIYGWWFWKREEKIGAEKVVSVGFSSPGTMAGWAAGTLIASTAGGLFMEKVHLYFPAVFPEAAAYPFIDTLTTLMSFTAMFLMARKKTESWIYWIIVDLIGIWLYYMKNVRFISVLYVLLLGLAIKGLWHWKTQPRMGCPQTIIPQSSASD
ncbi:nicotinamide riboside transporter PnuC [Desulfosarcina variabilis]|uniref:nicotinamide riboside transporter PnuC n=1 Tax=Desulfosarcina variabilis TaxID=2300 RepID=UPI003AFA502E